MGDEVKQFSIKIVTSAELKAAQDSAKALQDVGNEAKASSEVQVNAAKPVEDAEKKAFASKKDLRSAVKGLKEEFPALAHIARMAINPITLVVAGCGAAFAIWKYRVEEATKALAGVALPDISPAKVGQVTAMAEAYKSFKEALEGAEKGWNTVAAASQRATKAFEAEAGMQKKLLEARKGLELADLESKKTKMPESEYEQRKLEIEGRYARAGVEAEERKKAGAIGLQEKEAADLRADADKKLKASAGIKVGSSEQDAQTEEDLKKRAEEAKKDIDERKKWIGDMRESQNLEGSTFKNIATDAKMLGRYGYGATTDKGRESAIATEQGVISTEQVNIDRYNSWMRNKAAREEARRRKTSLASEAGQEIGQAEGLDVTTREERGQAAKEHAVGAQVAEIDERARTAKALGEARNKQKEDDGKIAAAIRDHSGLSQAVLDAIEADRKTVNDLEKRLKAQEGRTPRI